ncbi:MAG: CHRD domain-containing protein [Actinomycetota bacterium]
MTRVRSVAALALVLLLSVAVPAAAAPFDTDFAADLSGGQEVPPVDTPATGAARFDVIDLGDQGEIRFRLGVFDIDEVVASHIHLGCPGENGPVVAFLFEGGPTGPVNGRLAQGVIRRQHLVGPLEGKHLGSLVRAMESNCTYVNVHTTEWPGGEIRGQIFGTSPNP